MRISPKTALWQALTVFAITGCVFATVQSFAGRAQEYDLEASRQKLLRIGRALQLYRQEYGVKPVSQRNTPADAGLPPRALFLLGLIQDKTWSLPLDVFKVAAPNRFAAASSIHFTQQYWESSAPLPQMAWAFAERGEMLPILSDQNMNEVEDYLAEQPRITALILRLNGTVDLVTYNSRDHENILRK